MRKTATILTLLISLNIFSQEKTILDSDLKEFVLQCENIGRTITAKNIATNLTEWYDGIDKEKAESFIKQLESDINNSELDVTYYLVMLNENPLIYSFHFFNKETKEEFGQLFIYFKDKENDLVDDLKFVSKANMEMLDEEPDENTGLINIPPPPPPPPLKKKNEN